MQYVEGNSVRVIGRVPGVKNGDVLDPAALGWRVQNVRAMISQGLLEVFTPENNPPLEEGSQNTEDAQFFRVAGAGGKYFVVKGEPVTDLIPKAEADSFILEAKNGDNSSAGRSNAG